MRQQQKDSRRMKALKKELKERKAKGNVRAMELLDFWNRDAFDFILLQFVVLESIFIGLSVFYHLIHKYGLLQRYKVRLLR